MQLNKNIKIFINYFFGPLLFIWLSFSIYRQIVHQPRLSESWLQIRQSFQSSKIFYLAVAFILVPINWGFEAWKWKVSMKRVYPISFRSAYKAVLSGLSFSITMPNRVGEYLGRMLYLPEGHRLKTISVSLAGSFAQLLVTLVLGIIGLVVLKGTIVQHYPNFTISTQFLLYGLILVAAIMLLCYFNIAGAVSVFHKWFRSDRYLYLVEALKSFDKGLLLRILLISFLRYLVFMVQYILLFYLFGVTVGIDIILEVMSVVFLAMAIIPSIVLVEVWLRGEILIMLMGLFSLNTLGIGVTSVTVWFINLILPAIAGSLLLMNLKVFKKRNDTA
jgi:hypothetical protein